MHAENISNILEVCLENITLFLVQNFKQIMFTTEASNSVADSTQLLHYSFAVVVEYCATCNFSCYFSGQV